MIEITNIKRFEIEVDRFADSLGLDVVKVQKKLGIDIFADIVVGTPIDSGRAMNNWNISIQTIDRSVTDVGGTEDAIQSIKKAAALTELSKLKPFQTIWISNSVPYIGFLEEGSSSQAPKGWVEQAVRNNLLVLEIPA